MRAVLNGWTTGERFDQKSVVVAEIQTQSGRVPPQVLALQSTPFYEVEITDPDTQLSRVGDCYPDAQQALVRYILHWDSLRHQRHELCRQIEAVFPRW